MAYSGEAAWADTQIIAHMSSRWYFNPNRRTIMKDRAIGAFIGLAIGDALGAPVEFMQRDTFPPVTGMRSGGYFHLNAGEWTDDTAMSLAVAHSLLRVGDVDQRDMMDSFVSWIRDAAYTHTNVAIGLGGTVQKSLRIYAITDDPCAGSTYEENSGNGSIMRLAPVPIFFHQNIDEARSKSIEHSKTTHASDYVIAAVGRLSDIIVNNIHGNKFVCPSDIANKSRDQIQSTGFVNHTIEAAQWAVGKTTNFKDAVLLAVNLGVDADTVGAVAGQIAGSLYGYSGIPEEWRSQLIWHDHLVDVAERLYSKTIGDVSHPVKQKLRVCNSCDRVHYMSADEGVPTACVCGIECNPSTFRIATPNEYFGQTRYPIRSSYIAG